MSDSLTKPLSNTDISAQEFYESKPLREQADLERSAINDAYQEGLRAHFAVLVDNLIDKDDEAGSKFFVGLGVLRDARCIALQAIGN